MAKIIVTVDTEAKSLEATIDGKSVPELHSVRIEHYMDYDKEPQVHLDLCSYHDNDNGTRTTIVTTAKDKIAKQIGNFIRKQ